MTYTEMAKVMVNLVDELELLAYRRFGGKGRGRDRLLRNFVEEMGEYAEAVEYASGGSDKVKKFDGKATPGEKLREESLNLLMLAFAAVQMEGVGAVDACHLVTKQLKQKRGANS